VPSLFYMPDMITTRKLSDVQIEHTTADGVLTHSPLAERARPYQQISSRGLSVLFERVWTGDDVQGVLAHAVHNGLPIASKLPAQPLSSKRSVPEVGEESDDSDSDDE